MRKTINQNEEQAYTVGAFATEYPITQQSEGGGTLYTIYILKGVEAPEHFAEVISVIDNAMDGDTIIIKLNTPGGSFDSAMMLRDAIKSSRATVLAECVGSVASAGTFIALACAGLYIAPFCEFMIHNYSGGVYGKGNELEAQANFAIPHLKSVCYEVYDMFLTKKEIKKVIKGHDMYMTKAEVEERWERVIEKRTAEITEIRKQELAEHIEALQQELTNM